MMRWLAPLSLAVFLLGCPGEATREVCGDGIDNDRNGLTDCQDADCTGQPACVPPNYGSCSKCSQACSVQSACVTNYLDERPIPYCTANICQATEFFIQPRVELNTRDNWQGLALSPQSASTRFIRKKADDGSAVTCATVAAIAADRNAPSAIETSGKVVIQGLDVTRVTNPMLGQGITFQFVNTQTGGDYLMWVELWGGPPDSNNKMPTGRRFGYGCFEDASLTPLIPDDNCPGAVNPSGVCRTIKLTMPGPELP